MKHFRKRNRIDVAIIDNPAHQDLKESMNELVNMFDLVRIKFENHFELVNKKGKVTSSMFGINQQFLKLQNSIKKLNV
jgi:hypothetical protein